MKQIIKVFLSGISIFLTFPGYVSAQNSLRDEAFGIIQKNGSLDHYAKSIGSDNTPGDLSSKERMNAAKINARASKANYKNVRANFRAMQNFQRNYKGMEASWEIQKDARFATFRKDGIKTTVAYNKRGCWMQSLSYMSAAQAPKEVQALVQHEFPADDLTFAVQVNRPGMQIYVVQTENAKTFRQLAVCDGSVTVIRELNKAL